MGETKRGVGLAGVSRGSKSPCLGDRGDSTTERDEFVGGMEGFQRLDGGIRPRSVMHEVIRQAPRHNLEGCHEFVPWHQDHAKEAHRKCAPLDKRAMSRAWSTKADSVFIVDTKALVKVDICVEHVLWKAQMTCKCGGDFTANTVNTLTGRLILRRMGIWWWRNAL